MPALRIIARRCGYALAVHGSLKTDIDIVACPWREGAVDAEYLAERIKGAIEIIIGEARERPEDKNPVLKPYGRKAWSFYTVPEGAEQYGPYIDLSVMPITGETNE